MKSMIIVRSSKETVMTAESSGIELNRYNTDSSTISELRKTVQGE